MHRTKLLQCLSNLGGKIFHVCWIKQNGEERSANVRLHVKKHLKGGRSSSNKSNSYIPIYLMWNMDGNSFKAERGYRMLNLDTIRSINGHTVTPDPIFETLDLTLTAQPVEDNIVELSA